MYPKHRGIAAGSKHQHTDHGAGCSSPKIRARCACKYDYHLDESDQSKKYGISDRLGYVLVCKKICEIRLHTASFFPCLLICHSLSTVTVSPLRSVTRTCVPVGISSFELVTAVSSRSCPCTVIMIFPLPLPLGGIGT